jgi:hypothetical protein
MQRGRAGRSLGERAVESGVLPPAPSARPSDGTPGLAYPARRSVAAPDPVGRDSGEGRHCWVHDPPDSPGTWPGLLVEWRQRDGAWHGRVAYTVTGAHGPALVETWLPAARLEPR